MDWDKLRIFHAVADAGSLTMAEVEVRLPELEAKQKQIVEERKRRLENRKGICGIA